MRLALAFLACYCALNYGMARAAEIKATPISGLPDTALITVSGVLESSDAERFRAAVAMYPKAIVAFQSTGGSLIAGIDIGTQIRFRNYTALVPSGTLCASACATAWLGGTKRLMGSGALIGFHAAYIDQNGQATETGVGNALLGAYLNKLGLPDRAIVFITQAHPNELTWLTMADAAREGIDVALFTVPTEAPSAAPGSIAGPAPPVSPAPSSLPSVTTSLEQRASASLTEMLSRLSQSTSLALPYLSSVYADEVMYYGKPTRKQEVLQDNMKYMDRWPERTYGIIKDTVDCNSADLTCLINGQMRWSARSTARNIEAYGTSDFLYKFGFSSGSPQLLSQSSHVVTRSRRPIEAAIGALAPSASLPQYRDYPVARTYHGANAPVALTKQTMQFQTRLRVAAKEEPNFAGNYVLEYWGCGTTCLMGAVIDVATGEITWLPFTICCAMSVDPGFQAINFKPNSRLVVFAGLRNEQQPMGAHFYWFDGREFHFITTVLDDGSFGKHSATK
ncbi:hypothetical protein SAMN05519104_6023 [Rhizobiales bacterium GAS188]|nr:hypothetical protein SAMN05519104_6023 [Rhizobiales bacterium GAS188]